MAKQAEKSEAAEGASVKVQKPAPKKGKLRHVGIEVAENGYMVSVDRKSEAKGPAVGPYQPEQYVCKDLDDLDSVLDGLFGVQD